MLGLFKRREVIPTAVFTNNYVDPRALYLHRFQKVPSVTYALKIDTGKSYHYLLKRLKYVVEDMYQHAEFKHDKNELSFNMILMMLNNNRLIQIGADFVAVFHSGNDLDWAANLLKQLPGYCNEQDSDKSVIGFRTWTTNGTQAEN